MGCSSLGDAIMARAFPQGLLPESLLSVQFILRSLVTENGSVVKIRLFLQAQLARRLVLRSSKSEEGSFSEERAPHPLPSPRKTNPEFCIFRMPFISVSSASNQRLKTLSHSPFSACLNSASSASDAWLKLRLFLFPPLSPLSANPSLPRRRQNRPWRMLRQYLRQRHLHRISSAACPS